MPPTNFLHPSPQLEPDRVAERPYTCLSDVLLLLAAHAVGKPMIRRALSITPGVAIVRQIKKYTLCGCSMDR
jgi:hypothetical protein